MTLLEYRVFYTVSQQGSFARAAQVLHLTPSAISHAVSSMEESCGFRLFVRGRGGVVLTNTGEALYPYIRQVLQADDALCQAIDEFQGVQRGKVRIGAFNSVCVSWLPHIAEAYQREYPGIEIEIHQGTYSDVIEWLKMGVVDMGFLSTVSGSDLPVRPLYRDRLMCVTPRGYAPKHLGYVTPEELRSETFVVQGASVDADIMAFLAKYQINPRIACRVTDDLSTFAMVESGFGVSVMPALVLERYHGEAEVFPIEPMEYREFGVAVPNSEMMPPAVRQMLRVIGEYARKRRREMPASNADFEPNALL